MDSVVEQAKLAKENSYYVQALTSSQKNQMLQIMADAIIDNADKIVRANNLDMDACADKPAHFLDRLMLNKTRLQEIALGLKKLIDLPDPIGETIEEWTVKSGLHIKKIRVPIGVLGIIFEARPNVSIDAIGLALKSGNSIVLRGSRDADNSNKALVATVKASLNVNGYNSEFIQLLSDTSHEGAQRFMKCREYVDVLLPRGNINFIKFVVDNSTVPVIETGAGNCHAYIEKSADFDMALRVVINAKTSRPSVCNSLETALVDSEISAQFLPLLISKLRESGVAVVGCSRTVEICSDVILATDEDFYTEYDSLKISVKVVNNYNEAIEHINKYSTHHSETILTENKEIAEVFLSKVDSAAVYVNASTRFTDGFEFGFGAEMGISTQKIHARGPLGLKQLTSEKYLVYGNGQIR